jgi:hypothetical protein
MAGCLSLARGDERRVSAEIRTPRRQRASWIVAINVAVFVLMLLAVELAARGLSYLLRGSGTAGLPERTLNLVYEPFVMFGPGWDRRLEPFRAAGDPVVLLVGGSTAQGFAPEILARAIAQRVGRTVRVANAAYGGYEARQEVVVASLWAPTIAPAVIVSLDGQNDLEHRLRVDSPGRFFLDGAYRTYLTRPAIAPLAWLLAHSQAYNGLVRWSARRSIGDWTRYADAIPVYVDAEHALNVIARGLGAARLMVLQPSMAFKQPLAPEERAFTAYAYREPVMKALYDRAAADLNRLAARDQIAFLDARTIYDGLTAPLFSDDVHFRSKEGYEILARAIAAALPADAIGAAHP